MSFGFGKQSVSAQSFNSKFNAYEDIGKNTKRAIGNNENEIASGINIEGSNLPENSHSQDGYLMDGGGADLDFDDDDDAYKDVEVSEIRSMGDLE